MKWLLRPSTLMAVFAALVAVAALWVYQTTTMPGRPVPLPVEAGDREVAWLNAATSAAGWQRFVEAVRAVTGIPPGEQASPRLTTVTPEVVVPLKEGRGRLRIRWYKTTSEWDTDYWVRALLRRDPPPLAIIGGNTTDVATEQARALYREASALPEQLRPLLLLSTATADRVPPPRQGSTAADPTPGAGPQGVPLIEIYNRRTFRFCFSNRQMGDAVTRFIWSRDELRPDSFPVYLVTWWDDAYSGDLIEGFLSVLNPKLTQRQAAVAASEVGRLAGAGALGGFPLGGLTPECWLPEGAMTPRPSYVPLSVGSFDRPNRHEALAAEDILDHLEQQPRQQRPLLVLSGQSQPSRRFVRALCRLDPVRTRSFVVATGDTIAFNVICRDRDVAWPIQDLPCSLVTFCHQNPIADPDFERGITTVSGTEDLLLNKEMVAALVEANGCGDRACADADDLRERLRRLRLEDGKPVIDGSGPDLFDADGNRSSNTGEHVVWLRPHFDGERALPEATITVYAWQGGKRAWARQDSPLKVLYTGAKPPSQ